MLALKTNIATAVLIASLAVGITSVNGQQLPSERYQPVRHESITAPPSVHVPPQQTRQLTSSQTGYPRPTDNGEPGHRGATYNFSDAPQNPARVSPTSRGQVIQTSYQSDQANEPAVPEILAGSPVSRNNAPVAESTFQSPRASGTAPSHNTRKTPAQFDAQMQQIRGNTPRIAPGEFEDTQAVRREIREFQRQAISQQERTKASKSGYPEVQAVAADDNDSTRIATTAFAEETVETESNGAPQVAEQKHHSAPIQLKSTNVDKSREVSASDFISNLATPESAAPAVPSENPSSAPRLVAQRVKNNPATMRINETETIQDNNIRRTSAETETPQASIMLSAPAIQVETFGPQTVGIDKPATYKVVVTNNGSKAAERILVGIDLPEWVDLENVNLTTGGQEITGSEDQARLVWTVDRVAGNTAETISITAVPRKAEVFDLNVEWTLVPRVGAANIQVTQPRLEMNIVGPDEVQYGEQALYHVTVRNPGTGTAENVIVMLPEALGGERASLGDIPPGKDKNFQVELLARTAGELSLTTTAVADGNLKASSDRDLIVRRANLGILIEGPQLKYAGSVGQYFVQIKNSGDAIANEIVAAIALPNGVKYLGGIDSVKLIEGGLRWQVGSLDPGQTREYKINCQLDTSGDLQLEVGAQGKGDLQAAHACLTKVETVADLVLTVNDPKGPLPTGQDTIYEITIRNRGSRSAKSVDLVMQFSNGIEPKKASGLEHRIVPGQVLFAPIPKIDPGQEMIFKVNAEASKSGSHIFRAQLTCEEADSREIAEGTTRFFGQETGNTQAQNTANAESATTGTQDFTPDFKR